MRRTYLTSHARLFLAGLASIALALPLGGCGGPELDTRQLANHTAIELMDWHIAGLWVINSPVAWVRVTNYNDVPIKEITFEYDTFDPNGKHLDHGTYTIDGKVDAQHTKNFIELYVGLVDLYSEHLSVKLVSVEKG